MTRKSNWTPLTKLEVVEKIKEIVNKGEPREPYITKTIYRIRSIIERWEYQELYMKPSQNPLFKADTYVRPIAESGILGLVHERAGMSQATGNLLAHLC